MITTSETPEQALERIQGMGFGRNDALCIMAFADRGIAPEQITPRENVLTFRAWKATGRQVAKGAISVKVTTWIPCKDSKGETKAGEKQKQRLRPKTACLFHVSQTIPKDSPKGTAPDAWDSPLLIREGTYEAHPEPPAGLTTTEAITRAKTESQRIEYPDHVPLLVTEEALTLDESGNLGPDGECNCPAVGLVTNVDCPLHGNRVTA